MGMYGVRVCVGDAVVILLCLYVVCCGMDVGCVVVGFWCKFGYEGYGGE